MLFPFLFPFELQYQLLPHQIQSMILLQSTKGSIHFTLAENGTCPSGLPWPLCGGRGKGQGKCMRRWLFWAKLREQKRNTANILAALDLPGEAQFSCSTSYLRLAQSSKRQKQLAWLSLLSNFSLGTFLPTMLEPFYIFQFRTERAQTVAWCKNSVFQCSSWPAWFDYLPNHVTCGGASPPV